ncbi:hypothetical protein [Streptomyces sp. NPDC046385]|uniref:hypothetical protein n=1 Tax=Streptomyces sp. NPDC046385 TaxID=3154918 RepID=UPI0033E44B12
MSFDEEWLSARQQAAADVSMRLNGVDDGNGGRGGPGTRLHVDADVLDGRAKAADKVLRSFVEADDKAAKETGQVGAGLKGFRSAGAFGTFQKRWESQMRYVRGLLSEQVAGALRGAASDFRTEEAARAAAVKRVGAGSGDASSKSSAEG